MGLVKIDEAINTWLVTDRIDVAMRQFSELSPARQAMMLTILAQFHKEEMGDQVSNVVPFLAVANG